MSEGKEKRRPRPSSWTPLRLPFDLHVVTSVSVSTRCQSDIRGLVVPGVNVPPNTVRSSKQFVMYFASGLPLEPNKRYRWRIKIDHETRDEWTETFYVFNADAGPVIG